ncbi:aldehyde dehydrogenase (NAD(+)), partial [Sarracenia purpurea var. burkii]
AKLPVIALGTTAKLVPEPLGLVLIISSWNFPFGLSLEPLIGALAAGNVAVLKPSELAPASASVLAHIIPSYLDNKAVKVINGGPSVCEQLLLQKWDKIFFTGSAQIGRIVMTAAAKHLTPVTLELGGKCPAVVDAVSSSWDKTMVGRRILAGKFGVCAGQACIGIDYILTEKRFMDTLIEQLVVLIKEVFGENLKEAKSMARIVNKNHFQRLKNLLDDPLVKASIVYGGSLDEDHLFIEPTILVNPPLSARIMNEEIFGPLLPIISLEKIEDSVKFISPRPKPLAIYAFTKNATLRRRLISETSSGSLVINDALTQFAVDTFPFGGVGESGFGSYHGKFSFEAFTHKKAIMKRNLLIDFWFRLPPWNDHKLQLFKTAYRLDYLNLFLVALGLKKSA